LANQTHRHYASLCTFDINDILTEAGSWGPDQKTVRGAYLLHKAFEDGAQRLYKCRRKDSNSVEYTGLRQKVKGKYRGHEIERDSLVL
jgi:hypothetical protein